MTERKKHFCNILHLADHYTLSGVFFFFFSCVDLQQGFFSHALLIATAQQHMPADWAREQASSNTTTARRPPPPPPPPPPQCVSSAENGRTLSADAEREKKSVRTHQHMSRAVNRMQDGERETQCQLCRHSLLMYIYTVL